MELAFSASSPAYAQVAVLIDTFGNDLSKHVKLSVFKDPQYKPTLTVPALPGTSTKTTSLQGSSIVRYAARLEKGSLYDENHVGLASTSDQILYLVDNGAEFSAFLSLIKARGDIKIPILGDVVAYFYINRLVKKDESLQPKFKAIESWHASVSKLPIVTQATSIIDEAIKASNKPQKMVIPPVLTPIPSFAHGDVENSLLDKFRVLIADQMTKLTGADPEVVWKAIDFSRSPEHGDFAIALPQLRLKGNPAQLATEYAKAFVPNEFLTAATNVGPFMNFRISHSLLTKLTLEAIMKKKTAFGTNSEYKGKKAIIEFGSPNIAKPFHAGHLRSPIIGGFVANVHEACGWEVMRWNYLGDWGKQFGLLAVGWNEFGSEEELKVNPIQHLYEVYVKINQAKDERPQLDDDARAYFKRMEDGDEAALAVWKRFKDLSVAKLKETYGRLNIDFDTYSGEADVKPASMTEAIKILEDKGVATESEGSLILDFKKYKLASTVLRKRDGTSLYITRDIGGVMQRYRNHKFDKLVYIVATQQDLHFQQVFKALELMDMPFANDCHHVAFGRVAGMSTRKGTVVFLETILDTARETMHEVMKKNDAKYAQIENPDYVADVIGISAVMIQDMSARRTNDYEFNWARVTSFEGDTGPYLQYAHSRLASIERKGGLKLDESADLSFLSEKVAHDLVWLLAQYPDIVKNAYKNLEPSTIVTYAFKVAHAVSAAWDSLWVVNQEKEVAMARLYLYVSARIVLGNALRLLGLKPLDRM